MTWLIWLVLVTTAVAVAAVALTAVEAMRWAGRFNLPATGERWQPFTSKQRIVRQRPGFLWDARFAMLPGVVVRATWTGRLRDHHMRGGMQLPRTGEVAWLRAQRRFVCFRGDVSRACDDFAA